MRRKYDWWGYVKSMIRKYSWTKNADVTGICLMESEAVRKAVEATRKLPNGEDRLKVIDAVFWEKTHSLAGAAQLVPCHYNTAQQWHSDFILEVAKNFRCDSLL